MLEGIVTQIYNEGQRSLITVETDVSTAEFHSAVSTMGTFACSTIEGSQLCEACASLPGRKPYLIFSAPNPIRVKVGDKVVTGVCKLGKSLNAEEKLNQLATELQKSIENAGSQISFAKAYSMTLDTHPKLYQQYRREKYGGIV
jgi:hypothetical protein